MIDTPQVVRSISFSAEAWTVLMVEGQRYEVVRTEPHRRKEGRMTTLIVWQTRRPARSGGRTGYWRRAGKQQRPKATKL